LDNKIQALTVKEMTLKAHMQVHTNKESREKQSGPNRAETGLSQPAWTDQPSPFRAQFDTPFDLAASQAIYSPLAESHKKIHLSSATKE
jgi:hypothetical protein